MNEIKKVKLQSEIDSVSRLAYEIWHQHFVPIIGKAQVDYMLEKFQSANAILNQLKEGYEYYLILDRQVAVGYIGLLADQASGRLQLSKIYIKKENRGSGLGNSTLLFVKNLSKSRKIASIWLTVNRYNKESIDWYLRKGFNVVDEVKKDIGGGFYMDDYIMEIKLN